MVLGTAHLGTTPGKCSPDGRLKEAAYSREIVGKVAERLRADGYDVYIDFMGLEPNPLMRGGTWKEEQNKELLINKAKLEASLEDALLGKVTEKDKTEE